MKANRLMRSRMMLWTSKAEHCVYPRNVVTTGARYLRILTLSIEQVDKRIALQNDTSLQSRPSYQLTAKRGISTTKKKTRITQTQPQPRSPHLVEKILSRHSSRLRLSSLIRRRHSSRKVIINLLLRRTTRPVIIFRSFPFSYCGCGEMLQTRHVGF